MTSQNTLAKIIFKISSFNGGNRWWLWVFVFCKKNLYLYYHDFLMINRWRLCKGSIKVLFRKQPIHPCTDHPLVYVYVHLGLTKHLQHKCCQPWKTSNITNSKTEWLTVWLNECCLMYCSKYFMHIQDIYDWWWVMKPAMY